MSDVPALRLRDVQKVYQQGESTLEILKGVNLALQKGEMVALLGPSGAGKSTLLHMAGLLEQPDSGFVELAGESATGLKDKARTQLRQRSIGFVYQFHHLLPEFSALENLVVPQMLAGQKKAVARDRSQQLLDLVGLNHRLDHRPGQLSGGEQQRVALVRALVNKPHLLLADEPTGNLDPDTAEGVFKLLKQLVHGTGVAALIATHNHDIAQRMDRIVVLRDGHLEELK
ncbi:ABC transporter ATP-binding protein [Rhodovibrionaceae bacterium A322]